MKTRLIGLMAAVLLCACPPHASALSEGYEVTKGNEARMGLDFTLSAVRLSKDAVSVRLEITKQGKLENLKAVRLWIGPGTPLFVGDLAVKPDEKGVLVVTFQLSPELADQSHIDLVVPNVPAAPLDYEHYYAVELKGYITGRK